MSMLGGLDEELEQRIGEESSEKTVPFPEEKPKKRPFHYWKVGDREYKLKLNTSTIEQLENKYKTNVMNLVSNDGLPPLSVMLTIVQAAMKPWNHGVTYSDVKKMYDSWSEAGGTQMIFYTGILMPTMAVSGFFTEKQAKALMESMSDAVEEML